MKSKTGKPTSGYKKKSIFKIKKAISRFISNTQKIVQKVKPEAKIIVSQKKSVKLKNSSAESFLGKTQVPINAEYTSRVIHIPDFNGKL